MLKPYIKGETKLNEMRASVSYKTVGLDKEWVVLILKAKQIGLNAAEVRHFLNDHHVNAPMLHRQHD